MARECVGVCGYVCVFVQQDRETSPASESALASSEWVGKRENTTLTAPGKRGEWRCFSLPYPIQTKTNERARTDRTHTHTHTVPR